MKKLKHLKEKIISIFKNALTSGTSPQQLTLSCCIGLYIAFSPFPGLHTIMMLAISYFFRLNLPVLFVVSSINNPWTMFPLYSCDYAFGYWLVHSIFGIEPSWQLSLAKLFGSGKICLWSFLIGGNILAVSLSALSYPFVRKFFYGLSLAMQSSGQETNDKDIKII